MSVLHFDKNELGNLEYSLRREMLSTNRRRRVHEYHDGMLQHAQVPWTGSLPAQRRGGGENYVLLSSVDETIVQHDQSFNLAIHRFPGVYEPRGHKYIIDFDYTPTPRSPTA
ncbi:MAG: glycogen debranching enzyme N-terminal domain-containing protein [Alistipes indistinctus]